MRIPFIALAFLAAAPAFAQTGRPAPTGQLGARTQSPDQMAGRLSQLSPEEEMRALVAAADAHPLGSAENPVRVGGPEGERAYLGRLRCTDGAQPQVGARREAGVGAFGSVVAGYQLNCGGRVGTIVFDMYHEEHVETRAPAGFTLRP
ncbi:MAG TPA: hypothetical protein VMG08_08105 [Allosphingosinicella sp.]|nr:hypothetical protein [Allosphingosinicella sp.]